MTFSLRSRGGFTLIELLVVIGIMAVIGGVVGVGLIDGGQGAMLATARGLMQTQITAARSQAALRNESTAVVVVADPTDLDRYLRYIAVAVADDSGVLILTRDGTNLPGDIRVRPPSDGSTLLASSSSVSLEPGGAQVSCYQISFKANGALALTGGGELWLAVTEREAEGVFFVEDAPRVGIGINRYGAMAALESGETAK
ncbi:MAG: prepilin-type N-terminal cleavage/methylation domain-containing protein [Candidatus Synoicihabitans palmerolidicus]|nr:prepilin-type N-terminal cleavage/methylation domain-containing protein [Candidatus Synoicihabitans palmerolidicus]